MRIAVFVKPILQFPVTETDTKAISLEHVNVTMNEADSCAIEESIKLIKIYGGETTCISIGGTECFYVLKEALIKGINNAIFLNEPSFNKLDELSKAKVIVYLLKKLRISFDLLMFGDTSSDSLNGQLPIIVAELLGLPHITYVTKVKIEESKVVCEKRYEDEIYICEARMPAVLGVTVDLNKPKKIKNISEITIDQSKITTLDLKAIGLKLEELPSRIKLINTKSLLKQRQSIRIKFESYEEAANKLYEIIKNIK